MLELRRKFGIFIIAALIHIEGKPFDSTANNLKHLIGAINSNARDGAVHFLHLYGAFDLSIVSPSDTRDSTIEPEAEETVIVYCASRSLVIGADLTMPPFGMRLRGAMTWAHSQ